MSGNKSCSKCIFKRPIFDKRARKRYSYYCKVFRCYVYWTDAEVCAFYSPRDGVSTSSSTPEASRPKKRP